MKAEHKILHQKFVNYGANAKEWTRKCVLLLPEIEKHRIWEQKGFGSIYEYAAKLAGMSRETVNEGLRILRKTEDMPELRRVVEARGIGAVRPIATIATPETANFWAEKAMVMSKSTLETYVREFKKTFDDGRPGTAGNPKNRQMEAILIDVEPEIADELRKLKGGGEWNELMKEFLQTRREKLEEQKPQSVQAVSRYIPAEIKRHVIKRTNGICSFPGCAKPHEILHHTQRHALEKVHDPDRIEPLCKNHERIAHLGLIENENAPADDWRIRKQLDETDEKFKVDALVQKYLAPK